jgi:broad specificity phosphatase PhoE
MAKRVDALLDELRELRGNTLLFGHGHCFRSVAARFLDLPIHYATNLRWTRDDLDRHGRSRWAGARAM